MSINKTVYIMEIANMLIGTGCRKDNSQESPVSDVNQVKKEISEAADATGTFLSQQSQALLDKTQETFSQWEQNTQQLVTDLKDSGKAGWDTVSDELTQKKTVAQQKLEELKAATQENWNDTKKAFDVALADLKDTYQKAKSEYDKG